MSVLRRTLAGMASTGEVWRLGRRPALDGLRGIAILLVLTSHTLLPRLDVYGPTGVDLFFALSGFLITSILLEEREKTGRVDLVAFYKRRAVRLLPALLAFVTLVTLWRVATTGVGQAVAAAGAVLFYVGNWAILAGVNLLYMGHAWSLAVEEQFYLIWPLAMLALVRLPRCARVIACAVAVVCICIWRAVLWDRGVGLVLEIGSVERATPILLGCALAFLLAGGREGRSAPQVATLLFVALLAVAWVPYFAATEHVATGLVSVGLIICTARSAGGSWLEWAPLRLIGRRSYGLYLWHFPVMIPVMSLGLTGWHRVAAIVVTLGGAWMLALLSWRYIEAPVLRWANRPAQEAEKSSNLVDGDVPFPATI